MTHFQNNNKNEISSIYLIEHVSALPTIYFYSLRYFRSLCAYSKFQLALLSNFSQLNPIFESTFSNSSKCSRLKKIIFQETSFLSLPISQICNCNPRFDYIHGRYNLTLPTFGGTELIKTKTPTECHKYKHHLLSPSISLFEAAIKFF